MSPKRKKDIDALITQMKIQYLEIEGLYDASLHKKEVEPNLKIKVKSFLENARSVLDYAAHGIAETHNITASKVYFPIVEKEKNKTSFNGAIGNNLPGLEAANKAMFNYLESIQPYHSGNEWLADFATVVIDNKHSQLTPQVRVEMPSLLIRHGGAGIRISGGGSMIIGLGGSVSIGGAKLTPGQKISANSEQVFGDQRLEVKKEIWVDFQFNGNISALRLLKQVCEKIPEMIENIYKL